MKVGKVDVILRCRNYSNEIKERFEQNIRSLPVANVIIETSSPLGMATMGAIRNVQTEFFVAFDDDVIIPNDWLEQVSAHITSKVGAIDGHLSVKGFGSLDDVINKKIPVTPRVLQHGERAFGLWNALCRTEVFVDWEPSTPELSSWEDYELGMHVLKKGFVWITIPISNGYHLWSWEKLVSNAKWNARGFKLTHPSKSQQLSEIRKQLWWLMKEYRKNDELKHYNVTLMKTYLKELLKGLVQL